MNLDLLAREILRTTNAADPDDVAELMFRQIKPRDRAEALRLALRAIAREAIRLERMAHGLTARGVKVTPSPNVRNSRARLIRDHYQAALRNRVHAGPAGWKLLADCTFEDLMYAAKERRTIAARNIATAEQYAALASVLAAHDDAKTVGDLPEDVLRQVLGGEAA